MSDKLLDFSFIKKKKLELQRKFIANLQTALVIVTICL